MTPKEKALELYNKFRNENSVMTANIKAKKQALICVDEIIESEKLNYLFSEKEINSMEFTSDSMWIYERFTLYWEQVKEEINKL